MNTATSDVEGRTRVAAPTSNFAGRRAVKCEFAQSNRDRRFRNEHYDLAGGCPQTTPSDDSKVPLEFFVEYSNACWFEIVTAVGRDQIPSLRFAASMSKAVGSNAEPGDIPAQSRSS